MSSVPAVLSTTVRYHWIRSWRYLLSYYACHPPWWLLVDPHSHRVTRVEFCKWLHSMPSVVEVCQFLLVFSIIFLHSLMSFVLWMSTWGKHSTDVLNFLLSIASVGLMPVVANGDVWYACNALKGLVCWTMYLAILTPLSAVPLDWG